MENLACYILLRLLYNSPLVSVKQPSRGLALQCSSYYMFHLRRCTCTVARLAVKYQSSVHVRTLVNLFVQPKITLLSRPQLSMSGSTTGLVPPRTLERYILFYLSETVLLVLFCSFPATGFTGRAARGRVAVI